MEFLDGGIYRPIKELFDTPIYDRALQLCWSISSYKSQIALVRELLRLQQKKRIPSQVTAEDMISLLLKGRKNTLRESLWKFELEGVDEEDAKSLLKLVWAVNVSNKMRDIEFEAQMLLNSPEALPPTFQQPEVLSVAKQYARILRKKHRTAPSFKLLSPKEVVFEVVPRVLQGFWVLPPHPLLNMPSQRLSKMSVGATKAVLDQVSNALTTVERQVIFSRSFRDELVQSIMTKIRQMHPLDVLVNWIKSFAPVLLSEIVEVAVGQITGMFQPQSPKVPAYLTPSVEPAATTAVQEDFDLDVTEELLTTSPEINSVVVSTPPAFPAPPAEAPSLTDVEAREDVDNKACLEKDREATGVVSSSPSPPAEPPFVADVEARVDVDVKPSLENDQEPTGVVSSSPSPPAEPPSITDEAREDVDDKLSLENDQEPTGVVSPSPSPPAEPPFVADVEAREDVDDKPSVENDQEPTGLVSSSPSPPAEPPFVADVEARVDENEEPCLEKDAKLTSEPASVVPPAVPTPLSRPDEPVIITAVKDGSTSPAETKQPTPSQVTKSAEVSPPPAPLTSPTEPHTMDVQDRGDTSLKEGHKPTSAPLTAPPELVVIVNPEVRERREQGFFCGLFQSVCCCCVASNTEAE